MTFPGGKELLKIIRRIVLDKIVLMRVIENGILAYGSNK